MLSFTDWQERTKSIGASEIHNLSDFNSKGAQKLFHAKYYEIVDDRVCNFQANAGNFLEEQNFQLYKRILDFENWGLHYISLNDRVPYPPFPKLVASLDGYDFHNNAVLESKIIEPARFEKWFVKNSTSKMMCEVWKEYKSGEALEMVKIPKNYYWQIQMQMLCCYSGLGYFVVSTLTKEEKMDYQNVILLKENQTIIEVDADIPLQEEMFSRAKYFWDCINLNLEPSEEYYQTFYK